MPGYDMVVVGIGFAGSTATLIEAGKKVTWRGTSRWAKLFVWLDHPPATSVLRSSTFGRIVGASVAESLPESVAR